ncbi:hypothetical protein GRX01_09795 [Halobaculum sp. WSA2]|uniref:Uncharacterized protein n=1 Tax=Halobaculum saliterrae TaxID=2073113 RepID=A0A6B0SSU5_9EURY|nr:hypothetical protein [Halobaculum saliterrae]MXR41627.1 hypothetical protein [Halobaculum saliterrae]
MSRYLRATLADPTVRLGIAGGALTSASGLVAYVLLPIARGGAPGFYGGGRPGFDAGLVSVEAFASASPRYHALALALPAVTAGAVGALVSPNGGSRHRLTAVKLLGGNVLVPTLTVIGWYLVGSLLLAAGFPSVTARAGERAYTFLFVGLSVLGWGAFVAVPVLAVVITAVVVSTAGGYLLGAGLRSIREGATDG